MLEHARLRIGAVQNGDLAACRAFGHQILRFFDDPLRLLQIARCFIDAQRLAMASIGAQILAQPIAVMRNQRIGSVENVGVRTVILFQLDQILRGKLALESQHVGDLGAAKGIDALVIVAYGEHGAMLARHQLQPLVLQVVGVLEFVDQHVTKAALVMLTQRLVARQQLVTAQQQLGKVDYAFALALGIVQIKQLDHAPVVVVEGFHILGAQALILGIVDEVRDIARRVLLIVDVMRFQEPLDRRELILRIENLESLRQARIAIMRAQQAVGQAVESADPHTARIDGQHGGKTRRHLLGRLVGEGHGHDAARRNLAGLDQPGDARCEHARFSRTGAGQDQRRLRRQGDGGELFGVEIIEKILHTAIIAVCVGAPALRLLGRTKRQAAQASRFDLVPRSRSTQDMAPSNARVLIVSRAAAHHFREPLHHLAPFRVARVTESRITGISGLYCIGKQAQLPGRIAPRNLLNNLERTCQKIQLRLFFN